MHNTNSYILLYILLLSVLVRFPIGLDFLFVTFLLNFFLSWTYSLSISSSAIYASTLSNHVLLGLPTGLLPSTLNSRHSSASPQHFHITCPYHLSLPLLMTVVVGSPLLPTITLDFPAFTFNTLSRRIALHSPTRLPSWSIDGAISTKSSAYSNSEGRPLHASLETTSMTAANNSGLSTDHWCRSTFTSKL